MKITILTIIISIFSGMCGFILGRFILDTIIEYSPWYIKLVGIIGAVIFGICIGGLIFNQ